MAPVTAIAETPPAWRPPSAANYVAQRAYVVVMFDVMARLLAAASASDDELKRELAGFPEGYTIGFSVVGDKANTRMRHRAGQIERLSGNSRPDLDIVFKHVSHAFRVLSFQESSALAFARQRLLTHGDPAHGVRFMRCLNRVQAVALPPSLAQRALKAVPAFSLGERLSLNARIYAHLARGLAGRNRP